MSTITINIDDTFDEWREKTNEITAAIGDIAELDTTDKSSVVNAVNELAAVTVANPVTGLATEDPLAPNINPAVGVSTKVAREDHVHPTNFTTNSTDIKVNGVASVGESTKGVRADHVHPTDTSRASVESPTFTGTVSGVSKSMVGLSDVDNTSDVNKPVSSATQTALNGKANVGNIPVDTHAATSKTTPVDADEIPIVDSAASWGLKKLTWANIKTWLFGSPALTGVPTAPTAAAETNTTQIATTAFVETATAPSQLLTDIKTVDSAGSGLDADLLDGQDGNYYLNTSDTAQVKTGMLKSQKNSQTAYSSAGIVSESTSGDVHIGLHASGATATSIKHSRGGSGVKVVGSDGSTLAPVEHSTPANTDNSTNSATTAWMRNVMSGSLGTSGYQKFPNGITIQWGQYNGSGTPGGGVTVTFPVAFTTVYQLAQTALSNNTTSINAWHGILTNTNFEGRCEIGTYVVRYIAVGYITPA